MKKKKHKIIGLTGGAGSGKTEAAHFFAEMGCEVASLDDMGRDFGRNNPDIDKKIISIFGDAVIDENGVLQKKLLREHVFSNIDNLRKLDEVYYPLFKKAIKKRVDEFLKSEKSILVIDGAILCHAGLDKFTDEIILVVTPVEDRIRRIARRMNITKESALELITSQGDKIPNQNEVDHVILNTGTLEELMNKIKSLFSKIQESL